MVARIDLSGLGPILDNTLSNLVMCWLRRCQAEKGTHKKWGEIAAEMRQTLEHGNFYGA